MNDFGTKLDWVLLKEGGGIIRGVYVSSGSVGEFQVCCLPF